MPTGMGGTGGDGDNGDILPFFPAPRPFIYSNYLVRWSAPSEVLKRAGESNLKN